MSDTRPRWPLARSLAPLLVISALFSSSEASARQRGPRAQGAERKPDAGGGSMGRTQLVARLRKAYANPLARVGTFAVYVKVLGGPVLFARRGGQALHPASCVKLVTSAAALRELGADFRFVTSLYGKADGPVMATPLTLVGQGDPSLTRDHLQQCALAMKMKGIAEIP
ncbi:MAG: D-alanyl-D-alanine carboxypeptidase, partial [Polyangia bacterium]|nr:D-alanyl-D-alanine carboxypeptidase [Polyangia bacterium]